MCGPNCLDRSADLRVARHKPARRPTRCTGAATWGLVGRLGRQRFAYESRERLRDSPNTGPYRERSSKLPALFARDFQRSTFVGRLNILAQTSLSVSTTVPPTYSMRFSVVRFRASLLNVLGVLIGFVAAARVVIRQLSLVRCQLLAKVLRCREPLTTDH